MFLSPLSKLWNLVEALAPEPFCQCHNKVFPLPFKVLTGVFQQRWKELSFMLVVSEKDVWSARRPFLKKQNVGWRNWEDSNHPPKAFPPAFRRLPLHKCLSKLKENCLDWRTVSNFTQWSWRIRVGFTPLSRETFRHILCLGLQSCLSL